MKREFWLGLFLILPFNLSFADEAVDIEEMTAFEDSMRNQSNPQEVKDGLLNLQEASFEDLEALAKEGATSASVSPLDTFGHELLGLERISISSAWSVNKDCSSVVVGVIDTGVDYRHPDLINNIFVNSNEIPGNKIDDDKNGFVDDYYGYDFYNNDSDPMDDHQHGTHVAGTIGARGDNLQGVVGVCPRAQILPIKFLSDLAMGSLSDAIEAIHYAKLRGAQITNNSWGGLTSTSLLDSDTGSSLLRMLKDAIHSTTGSDPIFVAAAGNAKLNFDLRTDLTNIPSGLDAPNIVSVAASEMNDDLAFFSNRGSQAVDLAAPGSGIMSTLPNLRYGLGSGTSMASPHVSGALAFMLSISPKLKLNSQAAIQILLDSTDLISSLVGNLVSGGRLNLAKITEKVKSLGELSAISQRQTVYALQSLSAQLKSLGPANLIPKYAFTSAPKYGRITNFNTSTGTFNYVTTSAFPAGKKESLGFKVTAGTQSSIGTYDIEILTYLSLSHTTDRNLLVVGTETERKFVSRDSLGTPLSFYFVGTPSTPIFQSPAYTEYRSVSTAYGLHRLRSVPGSFANVSYTYKSNAMTAGDLGRIIFKTPYGQSANLIILNVPKQPVRAVALFSGEYQNCVILETGSLQCWGSNHSGQLGYSHTKKLATGLSLTNASFPADMAPIVDLTLSHQHSCALTSNGEVRCWGGNYNGNLGIGYFNERVYSNAASAVDFPENSPAIKIASGAFHTCALLESNSVYCWGNDYYGTVGAPADIFPYIPSPRRVSLPTNLRVIDLSLLSQTSCALLEDSSLWCWGVYTRDGVGFFTARSKPRDMFLRLPEGEKLISLTGRDFALTGRKRHSFCGISESGNLYCWGSNSSGTDLNSGIWGWLGSHDKVHIRHESPHRVDLGSSRRLSHVKMSFMRTCSFFEDLTASCWGLARNQEFGWRVRAHGADPSHLGEQAPMIDFGDNFDLRQIATGYGHECFLSEQGTVKCMGSTSYFFELGGPLENGIAQNSLSLRNLKPIQFYRGVSN